MRRRHAEPRAWLRRPPQSEAGSSHGRARYDDWLTFGDDQSVLELCAPAAVRREQRPAVVALNCLRRARRQERLDRDDQAFRQYRAVARIERIQNLRLFVDMASDTMPAEIAYHT